MAQARRRISYVIPPPVEPITRLKLPACGTPRLGSSGPLIIPLEAPQADEIKEGGLKWARHPRHRLGVASLALDVSTQLTGRNAPEGILYSGGRDGLVNSWDLGLPLKRREEKEEEKEISKYKSQGQWEVMTGWADDIIIDEELEESDGDVIGDVVTSPKGIKNSRKLLPPKQHWETDLNAFQAGTPSHFRQCAQVHTDWVNDILLCGSNQTVVSASSDGTVKAWNPHSSTMSDPVTIGSHNDYVRCLAHCREQNWVASGSFDRTIKIWDLTRTAQPPTAEALMTLNPPDATAPKSSVYALAADPFGHAIASGSPERVIRLWDPRSGKRTGKLVGHTDNIRAILMSEDSRYLLTGSADASIKIWSLSSQRCLHTFTHHTDSVWSLFSSHPSLEVFYSGDRSGLVCRVDVENCADVSEGECLVLCQDSNETAKSATEGVNKIVAMDDNIVWTASGASSIKRWQVPQRRSLRALPDLDGSTGIRSESPPSPQHPRSGTESGVNTRPSTGHGPSNSIAPSMTSETVVQNRNRSADGALHGIPFEHLVKLISPNEPFVSYTSTRSRDPEVATLYSAASVMSVPRTALRSPLQAVFPQASNSLQVSRTEETALPSSARADYELRELAADAVPISATPDHVILGDHGFVRSIILNSRIHALTVDTSGEVLLWDIARGRCLGKFLREDVAAASVSGSVAGGSDGGERERSPREALETVRERIEGEAVVPPWASADTKSGVLAVHITEKCFEAEVYADEVGYAHDHHFNDESKINIGKWVLRNLFYGFMREEQRQRKHEANEGAEATEPKPPQATTPEERPREYNNLLTQDDPRNPLAIAPPLRSTSLLTPMIPIQSTPKHTSAPLPPIPQSPMVNSNDITPMPQRLRSGTLDGTTSSTNPKEGDYFTSRTRQMSMHGVAPDDLSAWSGPIKELGPQTPITPGGLMGRLKNFGKMSAKRPASDVPLSPSLGSPSIPPPEIPLALEDNAPLTTEPEQSSWQVLLSKPLNPASSVDAPSLHLPSNTIILISEDATPSYVMIYRGTVSDAQHDLRLLEEAMPLWLLEYLLQNKAPATPVPPKLSFILLPYPTKDSDEEQLPELLNTTQSKLTASRQLRVRKLVIHVQDKLDKIASQSTAAPGDEPSDGTDAPPKPTRPRAEDVYEVLCNDVLLPLDMTLAAVRQYVWKQSTELVMHYRRKTAKQEELEGSKVGP
ncbi:hypothetical protein BD779DRAFT_1675814 [Infundibulicybe gibba]|nr:hypothetical protein BD779DRAFT_1675814 [Infundibulicybe gibba]